MVSAVDLGQWYWRAERLQRAADAAAMAGSVYLPGNPAYAAVVAEESLRNNGVDLYSVSSIVHVGPRDDGNRFKTSAYIAPDATHPNRLRVEVSTKVRNIFTSLLGHNEQYIGRHAIARYVQPVAMGSPGNVLGAEPDDGSGSVQDPAQEYRSSFNGSYWLNISGGRTDKQTGDRYSAGKCGSADFCSGGNNTEIGTGTDGIRGHQYIVHIPDTAMTPVTLQAFDGAYVNVGDHCNARLGTQMANAATQAQLSAIAVNNSYPANLYASGANSGFCTGDSDQASQTANGAVLTLRVQAADEKNRPVGPTIGSRTFPQLPQDTTSLVNALQTNTDLRQTFRRWADVVQINQPGTYIVTATVPDNALGTNRFSLRLGSGTAAGGWVRSQAPQLSLEAKHHLTIYTNSPGNNTAFYFARLTDQVAGRKLTLELYDIGDATDPVSMQFVAPRGATGSINFSGFGSCVQNGPGTSTFIRTPCGIQNATSAGSGSNPAYNGRVVKLDLRFRLTIDVLMTAAINAGCHLGSRRLVHPTTPQHGRSTTVVNQSAFCRTMPSSNLAVQSAAHRAPL